MLPPMPAMFSSVFDAYPAKARAILLKLRELIHQVASDETAGPVEESLKWGEPSFATSTGSPIRMDWKARQPEVCGLYFVCSTTLIETFRELFPTEMKYSGNRAIVLPIDESLPEKELRQCIALALRYHSVKHLPLLGL